MSNYAINYASDEQTCVTPTVPYRVPIYASIDGTTYIPIKFPIRETRAYPISDSDDIKLGIISQH